MSDERPLNPEEPYYTWSEHEGRLGITSECCGDSFSEAEERVLLAHLAQKYAGIDIEAMRSGDATFAWIKQALDTLNTIYDPNYKSGEHG